MRFAAFLLFVSAVLPAGLSRAASPSEITVDLRLDASDYIVGERVRGVLDIANYSPNVVGTGGKVRVWSGESTNRVLKASYDVNDRVFIEVYRTSDDTQLSRVSKGAFVASFAVETGEGQKLEVFLGDHYALDSAGRYMAKPVLVHSGVRYEGLPRVFDVVEGIPSGGAMQMFASDSSHRREFSLVHWSRAGGEHLFLKAFDVKRARRWRTTDLGPSLLIDAPKVSVCADGKVFVLHRLNQDQFVRSEFWSLPGELLFRGRSLVLDPTTAGTQRVRELYKNSGVEPKRNPWWKFW